ncbi:MAG: elongation factor P hydroxylase [Pseudomonadota bacterium]
MTKADTGALSCADIEACFARCFYRTHNVVLSGGFDEPYYQPARHGVPAELRYRSDYAASALHETAHWCIAGPRRRRLPDFGYHYVAAPRSREAQRQFLRSELRPQALERCFAAAAGVVFSLSYDDIEDAFVDLRAPFAKQVELELDQLRDEFRRGLVHRAQRFMIALAHQRKLRWGTLRWAG